MRLTWTGLRAPALPAAARAAIDLRGGKVLDWAVEELTGTTVIAGSRNLYAVTSAAAQVLDRPWHLVDTGAWNGDRSALTVTWVDGAPGNQWVLERPGTFPRTLRERVQASVVLAETLDLGERRTARVVIRKELGSGRLFGQTVLGRGVSTSDPGVAEATQWAMARLREQVGLDGA